MCHKQAKFSNRPRRC